MEYVNAFWIGGLICALIQILLDRTKMMPGRVMVLLVCGGAVLGFLNIYEPFLKFAGAGASVPLLGFGNLLFKGVKEDLSVYLWEDLRQVQLEFLRHLFLVTSLRSFSTRK